MSTRSVLVFLCLVLVPPLAPAEPGAARRRSHEDFTVAQLQAEMAAGRLTSEALTREYIARILTLDQDGPGVNAVMELNPDALAWARHADALRRQGKLLGPLHGIPVLLKGNIDTGDRMQTTAGSFGLKGAPAPRDSTVAARLRAGGAVILGKTNLSEWANFRSFTSTSGWSAVGGQTNNPYGINRNPCGSSSGSAAAATANFAAVSFGTETDGSIVCPANASGVVGIKPTVGLTSRAGVVPISHTQDTVGPHARSVADAAVALSVIQSRASDGRDPATGGVPLGWQGRTRPADIPTDYTQFLDADGLRGARLGVTRQGIDAAPPQVVAAFEDALDAMRAAGATLVDLDTASFTFAPADGEFLVLCYEFRDDLRAYLATRTRVPLAGGTIDEAIAFDTATAEKEMPFFGQEIFELTAAMAIGPDAPQPDFGGMSYTQALEIDRLSGVNGIDEALADFDLDAVVAPTDNPAWPTDLLYGDRFIFGSSGLAAAAGYPIVQVPAGLVFGIPLGISFFGTAFSEPDLIRLASGFEAVTHVRADNPPTFANTVPADHIDGTSLRKPRGKSNARPASEHRRPHHL
jgi:amidase